MLAGNGLWPHAAAWQSLGSSNVIHPPSHPLGESPQASRGSSERPVSAGFEGRPCKGSLNAFRAGHASQPRFFIENHSCGASPRDRDGAEAPLLYGTKGHPLRVIQTGLPLPVVAGKARGRYGSQLGVAVPITPRSVCARDEDLFPAQSDTKCSAPTYGARLGHQCVSCKVTDRLRRGIRRNGTPPRYGRPAGAVT